MTEKGAHIIASYYGVANRLGDSSLPGCCHRRRRPLFALIAALVLFMATAEPLRAQEVGGVRLSAVRAESGQPYLMVEFRGDEPLGMSVGDPMILSARTLIHASAVAVTGSEEKCNPGCHQFERALFTVKHSDLYALATSSSASLVLVVSGKTVVGRLDFDHLATIRRYVQQNPPKRET